jgi:hypothetical protein
MNLTIKQVEQIRHCIGLSSRNKTTNRNHFVTGPGSDDYDSWMDLVAKGYANRRAGSEISGGDDIFWVTRETALFVRKTDEHLSKDFRS